MVFFSSLEIACKDYFAPNPLFQGSKPGFPHFRFPVNNTITKDDEIFIPVNPAIMLIKFILGTFFEPNMGYCTALLRSMAKQKNTFLIYSLN